MLKAERLDYQKNQGLDLSNLIKNPFEQFRLWFGFAVEADAFHANAMVLSTVHDNSPSSRVVLLKEMDEKGFVFFTNYTSAKSKEIDANKNAAPILETNSCENNLFGNTRNKLNVGKKYHSGKISKGVLNGSAGSPNCVGAITPKPIQHAKVPKITTGKIEEISSVILFFYFNSIYTSIKTVIFR